MAYNPNNPNGSAASSASAPTVIANDQAQIPVISNVQQIMSAPTANTMAALNATVQYTLEAQANYYLTLTNGPAVTTAWVGTVTFQYSTNGGGAWSSLTAMPVSTPAGSANTTTAAANGLWLIETPPAVGSQQLLVRASMTSYTSGTAYFFVTPQSVNQSIPMPWVYSVTSGATLVGPIEASGLSEVSIQLSAVTTTVLTAQGTNDPTSTTWQTIPSQDVNGTVGVGTMTAALTYRFVPSGYKWVRIQVTTTGTVLTVQGVQAKLGQVTNISSIGSSVNAVIASGTVTTVSTVTAVTALTATNSVATTNGLSIGTVVTAATPATVSIKATAGRLHFISVSNPNAAVVYLKIFNVAAPTLGTTSANMNFLIPAGQTVNVDIPSQGLFWSTAIVIAVTGGVALADNTAITAGCPVNYSWI
jgi:hypothetical protein